MSIVWDLEQVRRSIQLFGGDPPSPNHVLFVDLVCRRKYNPALHTSSVRLERHVLVSADDAVHVQRWNPASFPAGLVVFVCPSPVNLLAALAKTQWQCVAVGGPPASSVYKQLMSNITEARAPGFMDIDLDTKDESRLNTAKDVLRSTGVAMFILAIIETVGGYHILYYSSKKAIHHKALHDFAESTTFVKPNFHGEPTPARWFSITRKPHGVPMPGTLQNGFPVTLVDRDTFLPDSFPSKKVCTK